MGADWPTSEDVRRPRVVIVGSGFAVSLVGMLLMTWGLKPDISVFWLCAFQVLVGIGNARQRDGCGSRGG